MNVNTINLSTEAQAHIKNVRRHTASGRAEPMAKTLERIVSEHAALHDMAGEWGEIGLEGVWDVTTLIAAVKNDSVYLINSSEGVAAARFLLAVGNAVLRLRADGHWAAKMMNRDVATIVA